MYDRSDFRASHFGKGQKFTCASSNSHYFDIKVSKKPNFDFLGVWEESALRPIRFTTELTT